MLVRSLHPWDVPYAEAIALQKKLASSVDASRRIDPSSIRTVAGVDVSSTRFSPVLTAGVVVWDIARGSVLETAFFQGESEFPYIPGLLSFREIPVLSRAIERLAAAPDAFFVDGQGIAHPRGMGIAAHLGLLIDVPTIGVAKSILCGTHDALGPGAGSTCSLVYKHRVIGTVLRSKAKTKPLIVSPGGGIDLASSVALVRHCLRGYRLPEPTRLAHLHVNAVRTTGHGLPLGEGPARLF